MFVPAAGNRESASKWATEQKAIQHQFCGWKKREKIGEKGIETERREKEKKKQEEETKKAHNSDVKFRFMRMILNIYVYNKFFVFVFLFSLSLCVFVFSAYVFFSLCAPNLHNSLVLSPLLFFLSFILCLFFDGKNKTKLAFLDKNLYRLPICTSHIPSYSMFYLPLFGFLQTIKTDRNRFACGK